MVDSAKRHEEMIMQLPISSCRKIRANALKNGTYITLARFYIV